MTTVRFQDVQDIFNDVDQEGSLRDVYVFEVTDADWQRFIDSLRGSTYSVAYWVDENELPFPSDVQEIVKLRDFASAHLSIDVSGVMVHCHFFGYDELELDIWSLEVDGQDRLNALLDFVQWIGRSLEKDVILTPENDPKYPFFKYEVSTDRVEQIIR